MSHWSSFVVAKSLSLSSQTMSYLAPLPLRLTADAELLPVSLRPQISSLLLLARNRRASVHDQHRTLSLLTEPKRS